MAGCVASVLVEFVWVGVGISGTEIEMLEQHPRLLFHRVFFISISAKFLKLNQ